MFSNRLIPSTRIRSLISGRNHQVPFRLCRNYLQMSNYYRTMCNCHQTELKCWNCNKSIESGKFSCTNCGVLQRPNQEMTYFQLLGLPESFDLDPEDVSSKYKTLQKIFHPDKFVQKSKEEIDISDHYSKLANKAHSTLKNPLTRGMYMLNLKGIPTEDNSMQVNQEFLMEILEKNEEVENLNDAKTLQEFQRANSKIISEHVSLVSRAFQKNDLQEAREVLMKLKYFINIENELKKKKSAMGIVD